MKRLSQRQRNIMDFIRRFLQDNALPPSIRDIQKGCGISSTSVVHYNLYILQREGYINRLPDISRGIELLDGSKGKKNNRLNVPVLGYIAAGEPLPTTSGDEWPSAEPLETIDLPSSFTQNGNHMYALKVKGTSMVDALIQDGDIVLIEPVVEVRNGDMVIAWLRLEKEATLKHFYHEGDHIRLQPANSQMTPIYVVPENLEVQGRVRGVLRFLSSSPHPKQPGGNS